MPAISFISISFISFRPGHLIYFNDFIDVGPMFLISFHRPGSFMPSCGTIFFISFVSPYLCIIPVTYIFPIILPAYVFCIIRWSIFFMSFCLLISLLSFTWSIFFVLFHSPYPLYYSNGQYFSYHCFSLYLSYQHVELYH